MTTGLTQRAVAGSCVVTVVARLPFVASPLGPDEGGFLLVGQQWHAGGTSLYGNYWVDRPPLLITIFGLAGHLGGAVPLRIFGMLAAVLVVVLSAVLARMLGGPRAAVAAAIIAAFFLANPRLGGLPVNGELLAAPLVLAGLISVVAAFQASTTRSAMGWASASGACLLAALMIKQNIADVGVFAVIVGLLAWRQHKVGVAQLGSMLGAGLVAMLAAGALVAAWALVHGTTIPGVYQALYPFRFKASEVLSTYGSAGGAEGRSTNLLLAAVTSGLLVLVAVCLWGVLSGRLRGIFAWGLLGVLAFDAVSIVLGGNYWSHYLVQPIGPIAVLAGVLIGRSDLRLAARAGLVTLALVALISWIPVAASPPADNEARIGSAIGAVAEPRDTIVSLWGNAQSVQASGLQSPYAQLWSLPVKTLDPHLTTLNRVLDSPAAPTWIVAWHHVRSWGLDTTRTTLLINSRYRVVATPCGHSIYLRNGTDRLPPKGTTCSTRG